MVIDLFAFLRSGTLALPKARGEDDFEKFLKDLFDDFLEGIDLLADGNWVTHSLKARRAEIAKLCGGIRRAVRYQFDGFPERAFRSLSNTVTATVPWLEKLGTKSDVSAYLTHLYRVRTGDLAGYDRAGLFHIPFEMRHLVRSQRYSIPGLPSLYLGGSLWICWEELGRPPFDRLHVARLRAVPKSNLRVLDFAHRPEVIASLAKALEDDLDKNNDNSNFILAQLSCWPLLAACSIRVRHSSAPFVPEYIVPQLLLQWIRKHQRFEGIRYFSTRPNEHMSSTDPFDFDFVTAESNYVFPTMKNRPKGYCPELTRRFEISAPLAWPIAINADIVGAELVPSSDRWVWSANPDIPVRYFKTHFSEVERKLNSAKCALIPPTG